MMALKSKIQKVKQLRFWLIVLTLIIVVFSILGYSIFGLFAFSDFIKLTNSETKHVSVLSQIFGGLVGLLLITVAIVTYHLCRAMEFSRRSAFLYAVGSSFAIGGIEQSISLVFPIGVIVITILLNKEAKHFLVK